MFTCALCQKEFEKAPNPPADFVGIEGACPTCSAIIYVQDSVSNSGVAAVTPKLDAGNIAVTDAHGFRTKTALPPGPHTANISLTGLEDNYALPTNHKELAKTIAANQSEIYTFTVDPLTKLKVTVKRRTDSNGVTGAKIKIAPKDTSIVLAETEKTTPAGGDVTFTRLRQDTYQLDVELDDATKAKFELEQPQAHHLLDLKKNPDEIVFWAKLIVHMKLKYKDPDGTDRFFPRDFPFTVVFSDASTKDVKILDDAGYFNFEVAAATKTWFTLKFDSTKVRYLVHEDGKPAAEVKEDPADADLLTLTTAGKKFFALPKIWSLLQSKWDGTAVPQNGQIPIPADGLGTAAAPAELVLRPKLQYARFEFFDRKYCASDHGNNSVGIPPVVLKGARTSDAAGVPQNPVAGTHDVISNWTIDKDDLANACQCLPWVITRQAADGADLPQLNNTLMFEFGWDNAFVHSVKATERKILILPATDARRKPTRDRNLYYDLPKLWKSKCYFTRFSDPTKNKFFDELLAVNDPDLEASYTKATKLTFSLDDVVLVSGALQAIQDKQADNTDVALSENSRVTLLWLDPADKYKVKVYKPRADAAYWSETGFQKEAATAVRRNCIVDVPINPRVVVFCDGFYDIYDKRTETANFGSKEILGARAAKLEDTDISSTKVVFNTDAAVTSYYVHLKRLFHLHYLHFGATDGTTVYGAMVTMWTCRFRTDPATGGTDADIVTFREEGMGRAMLRWNEKDYYFEEADDKKDVVVKHFCLFEAKGVQTAPGVFSDTGGPHICMVTVRDDTGGSSAAVTGLTMVMRIGGALDEGESWGDAVGTLPPFPQYDEANAKPKGAFAHELGHASIGLWDDYVTGQVSSPDDSDVLWKYTNNNVSMDVEGQRYFGMPFEVDDAPLMKSNRSVRLRYFWGRANWLNDQAAGGLVALLSSKRFRIAYEPAGVAKLKYAKPTGAGYESIYKPTVSTKPWGLGNNGRCDVHLYHLGEDEFSKSKNGGPYNGSLVLCLKISATFRIPEYAGFTNYKAGDIVLRGGANYKCKADHKSGLLSGFGSGMDASQWDAADAGVIAGQKVRHVEDLNQRIMSKLQDKFKLQGNGNFSTTYIRIFPQWEIIAPPTAATAGYHFKIAFVFGSKEFTPTGFDIVAGTGCEPVPLIRYMFGMAAGNGDPTKDELPNLKSWMDANAGGRFNVGVI